MKFGFDWPRRSLKILDRRQTDDGCQSMGINVYHILTLL